MSEFNPWEHGAPESERASMWSDNPGLVAPGAQPRTVCHVQKQMALVRMFERFIRHMLPREVDDDEGEESDW